MKHDSFLYSHYAFVAAVLLFLFVQSNAAALTVVLPKPALLKKESVAHLKQAGNKEDSDQWKLVIFGFAHCKDVCPLSLANFSALMKAAAEEHIKLGGIFVTVDPDRDTETVLSSYTENFDPNLSYLRLEGEDLERFKAAFGAEAVFYTKNAGNQANYQVDHSSTAFLIDPEGRIRVLFDALEDVGDIAKMLRENREFFKS
ncbi:MAG TPA: SCO family protein [Nitrosomonas sp.]|nr:SCO family protein [Nitrosomonas sp.]HNP26772.1 SCO family protein [Nitrosomonas sp.]